MLSVGFVRLAYPIKHRVVGEFHSFRVRLISENALLNMTLLLTQRAANGAHDLHGEVILNHTCLLLSLHSRTMLNIEHSVSFVHRMNGVGVSTQTSSWLHLDESRPPPRSPDLSFAGPGADLPSQQLFQNVLRHFESTPAIRKYFRQESIRGQIHPNPLPVVFEDSVLPRIGKNCPVFRHNSASRLFQYLFLL